VDADVDFEDFGNGLDLCGGEGTATGKVGEGRMKKHAMAGARVGEEHGTNIATATMWDE